MGEWKMKQPSEWARRRSIKRALEEDEVSFRSDRPNMHDLRYFVNMWFPFASIETDNEGQLVIYTGIKA